MVIIKEALEKLNDLPRLTNELEAKLTTKITQALADIDSKAKEVLKQIADSFVKWELELTKIQKEISDFKLETKQALDNISTQILPSVNKNKDDIAKLNTKLNNELLLLKQEILSIKEKYTGHQIINNITSTETTTATETKNVTETKNITADVKATVTSTNNNTTTNNITNLGNGEDI